MDLRRCLLSGVQAGRFGLDRTQGGGVKKKKPGQRGGTRNQEGQHLGDGDSGREAFSLWKQQQHQQQQQIIAIPSYNVSRPCSGEVLHGAMGSSWAAETQKIDKHANKGVKSQLKSKWIMDGNSSTPILSRNYHTPREHCKSLGFRGKLTKVQIRDLQDFNLCFKCRGTAEPDAGKHRPENCNGQDLNSGVGESECGINADNGSSIKSEVTQNDLIY